MQNTTIYNSTLLNSTTLNDTIFNDTKYNDTLLIDTNESVPVVDYGTNLILPFNRTRIPSSEGSKIVQTFIRDYFKDNLTSQWHAEIDSFEEKGLNFTNLIYTLGGPADKYIVLSAHYDSKIEPEGFIGAIDSAASCAILLYVAKFIDYMYANNSLAFDALRGDKTERIGLKIVFFDGEEALKTWGPTDSIYGSKHLAEVWKKRGIIEKIDLFILMDLIGSNDNQFIPSYYIPSYNAYSRMSTIEDEFIRLNKNRTNVKIFNPQYKTIQNLKRIIIEDDQVPFLEMGCNVLHLIPLYFPEQWHTIYDDFKHLDESIIQKWAVMISEFTLEQLTI